MSLEDASGASLEVFRPLQRSLAAPRSPPVGGRPAGPSRFGVTPRTPAPFGTDRAAKLALAGLRFLQRLRSEGARRGGRAGVGVPAGSEPASKVSPRCAVPVGGLLPVPVVVTISRCGDVRGTRIITLTADPTTRKRRRLASAAHAGSCTAAVSRAVFRYPDPWAVQRAAWPDELVLPSARPAALLGFRSNCPSQVWSRSTGGAHVSVRPGPRVVRAASSAPIFFVGVADCSKVSDPNEVGRPGMKWRRLPGFAPIRGPPPPH